jgi:hypothetical protein
MFSRTNENNRTFSRSNRTQSLYIDNFKEYIDYPSSFGMSVQLSDNHTADIYTLPESLSLIITGLPNATVHDKNNIIRRNSSLHLNHFLEQLTFLFMTSRSIHDYYFKVLLFEMRHSFRGDLHWVGLSVTSVKRDPHFSGILKIRN